MLDRVNRGVLEADCHCMNLGNPQSQTDLDDVRLVLRCQLGNREAWDAIVRRWNPRLRAFVSRMLTEQQHVDDIMQSAWLKIVRSLWRLDDPEKLAAWLYRVVRLTIVDHLRRSYRSPPRDDLLDVADVDPSFDQLDVNEQVESALLGLHPTDRETVVLHYFDQMSVAEVATICGVPEGTVKSRLHRSRTQLRLLLQTPERNP